MGSVFPIPIHFIIIVINFTTVRKGLSRLEARIAPSSHSTIISLSSSRLTEETDKTGRPLWSPLQLVYGKLLEKASRRPLDGDIVLASGHLCRGVIDW